jgi:hypothetical protein
MLRRAPVPGAQRQARPPAYTVELTPFGVRVLVARRYRKPS